MQPVFTVPGLFLGCQVIFVCLAPKPPCSQLGTETPGHSRWGEVRRVARAAEVRKSWERHFQWQQL